MSDNPEDPIIHDLAQLADHVGATRPDKESIARRLYKDTDCGISFWTDEKTVVVSGYCEGTDRECPPHPLAFPFRASAFDEAVEDADRDGCNLWDDTHGCNDCQTDEFDGDKPVDPTCKSCGGHGIVI